MSRGRNTQPQDDMDPARRDLVASHHAGNDGIDTLKKALGEVEFAFSNVSLFTPLLTLISYIVKFLFIKIMQHQLLFNTVKFLNVLKEMFVVSFLSPRFIFFNSSMISMKIWMMPIEVFVL